MFGAFETDRPAQGTHFWNGQHYKYVEKTGTYFRYCTFTQKWRNSSMKALEPGNTYQERLDRRNLIKDNKAKTDAKCKKRAKNAKKVSA